MTGEPAGGPLRIAMWSGPRNLSTALMRSFGTRPDCHVVDEPFYGAYLSETGIAHPMRDAIIASQPGDWRAVAADLAAPVHGKAIQYEKHMLHHMVPAFGREWLGDVRSAFLIRHPVRVIASYARGRAEVALEDLGYSMLDELFRQAGDALGAAPAVVDCDDILCDPEGVLVPLCDALGVGFAPQMLAWPAGRRETDGVWAPHWYASVERSTGFTAPGPMPVLDDPHHLAIAEAARPLYDALAAHRIRPRAA